MGYAWRPGRYLIWEFGLNILIIGAGAVGTFVGARLALAGHDVTLVGRPGLAAAVRGGGLTLIEPSGSRRTTAVRATESIAAAFHHSPSTSASASASASTIVFHLYCPSVKCIQSRKKEIIADSDVLA